MPRRLFLYIHLKKGSSFHLLCLVNLVTSLPGCFDKRYNPVTHSHRLRRRLSSFVAPFVAIVASSSVAANESASAAPPSRSRRRRRDDLRRDVTTSSPNTGAYYSPHLTSRTSKRCKVNLHSSFPLRSAARLQRSKQLLRNPGVPLSRRGSLHHNRGVNLRLNPARNSGSGRGRSVVVASAAEMAPAAAAADQASQTPPESFGVSMYPVYRTKVIHIVRHGQGFHNVAGEVDHANYMSWDYADASLTDLGWQQSEALHQHLDATGIKAQVELVVVSPLLRTLQTASGVFGEATLPKEGSSDGEELLMVNGLGKSPHAAISAPKALKFVANEYCREQNGVHPCDRRSNISFYKKSFPHVDFSEVATDEDTWWSATTRETAQELFTRARTFVRWLLDRPESRITVVSHSSFIFHMCHLFGADCSDVVRKEIQQGFRNCEMRSVVICDRLASGPAKLASTDFAGGLHYNDASKKEDVPSRQIVAEDKSVPQADSLPTLQ